MKYEELLDAKAIVEIDDVHAAHAIVSETRNMFKELRMFRTAQMLAALREYYVKVGANVELEELAKNIEDAGPDALWTGAGIAAAIRERILYKTD